MTCGEDKKINSWWNMRNVLFVVTNLINTIENVKVYNWSKSHLWILFAALWLAHEINNFHDWLFQEVIRENFMFSLGLMKWCFLGPYSWEPLNCIMHTGLHPPLFTTPANMLPQWDPQPSWENSRVAMIMNLFMIISHSRLFVPWCQFKECTES